MLDNTTGRVDFEISNVASAPTSLIIVNSDNQEQDLIGLALNDDVWNGAATVYAPVTYADGKVSFAIGSNHAASTFTAFRLG